MSARPTLFPPAVPSWEADLLRDLTPVFDLPPGPAIHLAILVEPYLQRIMREEKTIESRWSMNRCAPFGQVMPGDAVIFKRSGGPIVGFALATWVRSVALTSRITPATVIAECGAALGVEANFIQYVRGKRYVTLVGLAPPLELRASGIACGKRDRAGWNVLRERGARC